MITRATARRTPLSPATLLLLSAAAVVIGAVLASGRHRALLSPDRLGARIGPVAARTGLGPPPDDATLREQVEAALHRDERNRGRVDVRAQNGAVVLHGELDSPDQITAAQQAAEKVRGVRSVSALISTPTTHKYRHLPKDEPRP